ncbi:MAG: hypothetical protein AB7S72_10675 [Draconibacterium sp.]
MKSKILIAIIFAAAIGFTACQKDELGVKGPSSLDVKIEALNKSYKLPVSDGTKSVTVTNASITWDTVQLVVSQIKFEAALKSLTTHRDSIEIEYKWSGPTFANLLNDKLVLGNFMLQPGFYDEIELKVYGSKHDAGTKPVFYMFGNYTSSQNAKIPVAVKVYNDVQFKTEKDSVTVTEESVDITSYIQLYLDKLMVDIDPVMLDNAKLTNGVIVISADSNRQIYYTMVYNLVKNHYCYYKHKNK